MPGPLPHNARCPALQSVYVSCPCCGRLRQLPAAELPLPSVQCAQCLNHFRPRDHVVHQPTPAQMAQRTVTNVPPPVRGGPPLLPEPVPPASAPSGPTVRFQCPICKTAMAGHEDYRRSMFCLAGARGAPVRPSRAGAAVTPRSASAVPCNRSCPCPASGSSLPAAPRRGAARRGNPAPARARWHRAD
jgi:hypothetical protein